jgi:type IV secretion system protein VirB10
MSEENIREAQITNRTDPPRGVIPKNAQALVLGLIALVMVLIIMFSGRGTPSKQPHSPTSVAAPVPDSPNPATIDDFVNHMDARAKKLAEAKAALEQDQKDLLSSRNQNPPGPDARGSYYLPAGGGYRPANSGFMAPAKVAVQQEQERREAQAPFASNIALSYRQHPPTAVASGTSGADTGIIPNKPNLLDLLSTDSALANAAAAQFPAAEGARLSPDSTVPAPSFSGPRISAPAKPIEGRSQDSRMQEKHYLLLEGSFIETALTNRLDATFSGPVVCIVTTDVYTQDGRHLLIPRGARVIGEVKPVDNMGQQRVAVFFHRIILPNERSISLDQFVGLNQIGETGLRDQVSHHYFQIFGAAAAVGSISGLAQANTRYGLDATSMDVYRQGVSSSLAQSSMHILDRFLNIPPTFTVREGHRIKVYLAQDIQLPEYNEVGIDMSADTNALRRLQ